MNNVQRTKYNVMCCDVLCCAVLRCTALRCAALCCAVQCAVLCCDSTRYVQGRRPDQKFKRIQCPHCSNPTEWGERFMLGPPILSATTALSGECLTSTKMPPTTSCVSRNVLLDLLKKPIASYTSMNFASHTPSQGASHHDHVQAAIHIYRQTVVTSNLINLLRPPVIAAVAQQSQHHVQHIV